MEPLSISTNPNRTFTRQMSSPGIHEQLTDFERNIPITGIEPIIAQALEEFNKNTFHNYLEYLLVVLEMPANVDEYKNINGFQPKVTQILKNWTTQLGNEANLGLLTEKLRNHRSINDKIYKATMASVGTSV